MRLYKLCSISHNSNRFDFIVFHFQYALTCVCLNASLLVSAYWCVYVCGHTEWKEEEKCFFRVRMWQIHWMYYSKLNDDRIVLRIRIAQLWSFFLSFIFSMKYFLPLIQKRIQSSSNALSVKCLPWQKWMWSNQNRMNPAKISLLKQKQKK